MANKNCSCCGGPLLLIKWCRWCKRCDGSKK